MDQQCDMFESFASSESVLTPVQEYWRVSGDIAKAAIAQAPNVAQKTQEEPDESSDEDDFVLPRKFLPQGVDWDCKLEDGGYGRDVVVYSESESSLAEKDATRISSILMEVPLANAVRQSMMSARPIPSKHEVSTDLSGTNAPSQGEVAGCQLTVRSHNIPSTHSVRDNFAAEVDNIVKSKTCSAKRYKLLKNQQAINTEIRSILLRKSQEVDIQSLKPSEVMRRVTLELTAPPLEASSTFRKKSLRKSLELAHHKLQGGDEIEELRRITRELGSTDLIHQLVVPKELMDEFCYEITYNSKDLVLQGKQVSLRLGRRLQDFDVPYILAYIIAHPEIVYLDLSYNNITSSGAWYFMHFLSTNTTLQGLNLMNNDIAKLDGSMVEPLSENKTLKSLRLNGNPIGRKGGEAISVLLVFKELEHLDLGQTDQTVESLAWIAQSCMQTETLKVLDLSRVLNDNGYVTESLHFAIAFSDILRFCSSLVELHLQKNQITDVDLEQLLFGLSFNKTLELIDLSCNHIGDYGAEMIANALRYGAPLQALMVGSNRIGNSGARALSFKLPFSQIKLLDLSCNLIQDQGIVDIAYTVKKPYPLLSLFIFGNKFGVRATKVIEERIAHGDLNEECLDINILYCDGQIGHGRNTATDRYRARYYRIAEKTLDLAGQNLSALTSCDWNEINYIHHNKVTASNVNRNRRSVGVNTEKEESNNNVL